MRRKSLIIISISLLVLIVIGISYSFYSATIIKNKETITKIDTKVMGLIYTGEKEIDYQNMIPGDIFKKTFNVEDIQDTDAVYNIYMENTINEYSNNLVYSLEDDDGLIIDEAILPKSNNEKQYILTEIPIVAHDKHNYTLTIKYLYDNEHNQNIYFGKSFNTHVMIDTEPLIKINKSSITCDDGDECIPGGIIDDESSTKKKKVIKTDESYLYYIPIVITEKNYGEEIAINHDIYYHEEELYSNGLNKRYQVYCTPYTEQNINKVRYCSKPNGKGSCRYVTRSTCSYEYAMKDYGYTLTENQNMYENFADRGNGNWHIQTYCSETEKGTAYDGGYYCDNSTTLHDWYNSLDGGSIHFQSKTPLFKAGGSNNYPFTTDAYYNQTVRLTDNGYYFYCASQANYTGYLYTSNKIDITNYKYVVYKYNFTTLHTSGNGSGSVGLMGALKNTHQRAAGYAYYGHLQYPNTLGEDEYYILDVSDKTGEYYLSFEAIASYNQGYVKEIFLAT